MKILSYVFVLVFLAFTAVQYNDPDGTVWMVFYLILALLSLGTALGRVESSWLVVPMIFLAFGMGIYFPGVSEFLTNEDGISFSQGMQNNYPYIEEAREFGGLLISFLGVLGMWWLRKKASA